MANTSILAAFERMWLHIASALGSKMNSASPTCTGSFSMNRQADTTVGSYSVALGYNCEATEQYSHAEGYATNATGFYSHAEGSATTAAGNGAHAEGYSAKANGNYSHAGGYSTTANANQYAIGHYNNSSVATAGSTSGTSGNALVVGNGTSSSASNAFRVTYAGQVYGKSSYQTAGADYAEYFEWSDKNPENEDRVGYFVTFDNGRFIRKANEGEYVLGIVSGHPSVLGNSDECWMGMNETDEWGRFIRVKEIAVDEGTGETYEYETYKVNPDFDKTMEYIPRSDRPEWDAVGILGVLSVHDDGTCQVNGYCKVSDGGIAAASDSGYRVIERISDNIVRVIFR